jgi:putative hydrolase of the HAD superfamily
MAHPIHACLFDLYDTLVYFDRAAFRMKVEVIAQLCHVEPSDFERVWKSLVVESNLGQTLPRTQDRVREALIILGTVPEESLIEAVAAEEHGFLRKWSFLYPETNSTLTQLRDLQVKVGLVTNASRSVWEVIRAHKIESSFDCIVVSSDIGVRKPDAKIYLEALDRLGVRPSDAAFAGDGNDQELDGAKAVGLTTICVDHHTFRAVETQQSDPKSVDFVIHSLQDIPWVLGLI